MTFWKAHFSVCVNSLRHKWNVSVFYFWLTYLFISGLLSPPWTWIWKIMILGQRSISLQRRVSSIWFVHLWSWYLFIWMSNTNQTIKQSGCKHVWPLSKNKHSSTKWWATSNCWTRFITIKTVWTQINNCCCFDWWWQICQSISFFVWSLYKYYVVS